MLKIKYSELEWIYTKVNNVSVESFTNLIEVLLDPVSLLEFKDFTILFTSVVLVFGESKFSEFLEVSFNYTF